VETLKRLTHTDPAAVQILLTLHVGQAARTVQSLVGRVMLLNQLVEYLTHVDPAAARRLGSALPVLHQLLFDLIVSAGNGTGITVAARVPIVSALGHGYGGVLSPTHRLLQLLAADGVVTPFTTTSWAPGSPAHSSSSVGVRIIGGGATIKRPAAATASGSVAAPAVLPPPLAGGAPAGVSGGVSSGVGASTALIASLLTVSLLYALLGERVVLTLFPWRSRLLATRLERPG
jgi:hypothetical protein